MSEYATIRVRASTREQIETARGRYYIAYGEIKPLIEIVDLAITRMSADLNREIEALADPINHSFELVTPGTIHGGRTKR